MILIIISVLALITSGFYLYFIQFINEGFIIWWSIPIVYLVAWLAYFALLLVFIMVGALFKITTKNIIVPKKFYYFVILQMAKFLVTIYNMEVVFENKELIPEDKKFLIVSNHQSNLDPIALVVAFQKNQITYLMKDNMMRVPFIGRWLYNAGFLPLDRKNDRKALEVITRGIKRLKYGLTLAVFPEGTRSKGPNVKSFRHGIFKLAQKSESPILVVTVDGFYKVKRRFPFRRTKVLIRVCELIPYQEFADLHTNEIGENIKMTIEKNQEQAREKYDWLK